MERAPLDADTIICMHNATADVARCLDALVAYSPLQPLLLVDDASRPPCSSLLGRFVTDHPTARLMRNDVRLGYTRSANRGLRESRAGLVVLLNSDTVVTRGWLEQLIECAESDPRIGIVGPLSNSATFQSVPQRRDRDDEWAQNALPAGWTPDDMATLISQIATCAFPRVAVLNGFCFGIKRAVIDAIGYFDEEAFPDGYGEELDYCFRAAAAGFALAVADHAYVYHAGNRSYGPEQRAVLKQAGRAALLQKHKAKRIRAAISQTLKQPALEEMRERLAARLSASTSPDATSIERQPLAAGAGAMTASGWLKPDPSGEDSR